ncbi:MAG: TetR/AcrR family transcriptional regulator [Synoicihabitans sp.]
MARPPQFDRTEVLEKATQLFWERGYRGVSISDLVKATGLLPGSIYAGFGNKEGLFVACLQHYGARASDMLNAFESAGSPLGVVRTFFVEMSHAAADEDDRRGCFLVNASLECDASETAIKTQVRHCMDRTETWLQTHLEAAKANGELRQETDVAQLAGCLVGAIFGIRVMSRAQETSAKIESIASATFESLMAPWEQVAA